MLERLSSKELTAERLYLHAGVRIEALEDGRFRIDHLTRGRRWEVGSGAFSTLAEFVGGALAQDVLTGAPQTSAPAMETWILEAVKSQILVAEDDAEHLAAQALRREWEKNGWPFASEYQLATFSFPFLDYSTHGVEADASRMAEYVASEPDPGIVSNCTVDVSGISLPETRVVCEGLLSSPLPRPSRQTPTALDRETLLNALAGTFGELRVTDTDSRRRTRRTSPSGGARHPSEGYVVALDVAGLANGIYHCCWRRGKLHRVGGATQVRPDVVRAACPWFYRFGDPAAIVIVTAVFERNMFRYREPRTLRTIFMDAGHLCSTLELLCAAYGLPTLVHHGIDDERVEELLNLEPLTEAAIAAVAIGVQE